MKLEDRAELDTSIRQTVARANLEFDSSGALTKIRRQMLADAVSELATAREAVNEQNLVNMSNALKRATGHINALVVDVMTNMG